MPIMLFVILALIFVILLIVVTNIVIVPQSMVYVVERLGSYSDTWSAGLHVKIPFIERIAKKVSLKEQVADFPPQPVITRDNVTMQIDTVVFFQVMDAKLYTYGVNQPIAAIESLSATTLRNIIGEMELDHTLTSRDVINGKITAILDEATDKWGIKVNRVEVKNIIPNQEIVKDPQIESYFRAVADAVGIPDGQPLDTRDRTTMLRMAAAVSRVENGATADMGEVELGWELFVRDKPASG